MVGGLKVDERVQALAKDVLDEEIARRLFAADWETKRIQGKVVERRAGPRSVKVRWDRTGRSTEHATRLLDRIVDPDASTSDEDSEDQTVAQVATAADAAQPPPPKEAPNGKEGTSSPATTNA